jgi:A/G-specific adenine glycosylase
MHPPCPLSLFPLPSSPFILLLVTHPEFTEFILTKGQELYREMPWRQDTRPYYIMVSEIMLQQTQVDRVIPKFNAFITQFPSFATLAAAPLAEVLIAWQGLGYNRRAKFLHQAAKMIVEQYHGQAPQAVVELVSLPGIGVNTAGAIMAFAYNQPLAYIETNVRTVYIHHFFVDDFDVTDKQLLKVVEQTVDRQNPRQFYWALMDYGSHLKRSGVKNIHRGKHYKKQSPLKGSLREARGIIIKRLAESPLDSSDFRRELAIDDRFDVALEGLIKDGLVISDDDRLTLAS